MSPAARLQSRQADSAGPSSMTSSNRASIREIRPHEAGELDTLLEMCAEHAEYELACFASDGQVERWRGALENGDVHVFFARLDGEIVGFAAMSLEYSTWRAELYGHLDCLYVRSSARGRFGSPPLPKTRTARASGWPRPIPPQERQPPSIKSRLKAERGRSAPLSRFPSRAR